MATNVTIETEECIGCQSCVELCPEVFGFDEDNEKAFVKESADPSASCIEEAVDTCPVECIHQE
jgi:ferredoxin